MDARKNFEAYTSLKPLKKNAVQLCGEEFIKSLINKKIYAKADEFWIEVNKNLSIPDDYYEQKQIQQQKEQDKKQQEEETEKQRLMDQKELVKQDNRIRDNWIVKVFQLPKSERLKDLSQKYLAEGTLIGDDQLLLSSHFSSNMYEARNQVINSIDNFERQQRKELSFLKHYKVLKQIYMIFLYLSGWDNYNKFLSQSQEKRCKENFTGVESWIGLEFSILDKLEEEGLLEQPQTKGNNYKKRTYVQLTKKGIRMTRELLKNIDLEGVDELLEDREYHEEYLHYKTSIDLRREQESGD
ncbi:DUF6429 family protein [Cyanothece sp. BG0011]|uniref:DUF6429 family protein n=1 Tax=Cyanothece sp. BG0011 TaxID=2082950 RepID=UPI0018E5988D|nr:DUF6429 family protein [Cyanothece sp. BG0011]